MTVGAAFGAKTIQVNGKPVALGIWDTAGAERYESMTRLYYKSASAAIVCYDMTEKSSFEKVRFWVNELTTHEDGVVICIVGTKCDLLGEHKDREVSQKEVEIYASRIGAQTFSTSAKTGENVDAVFQKAAELIMSKPKSEPKAYSPHVRVNDGSASQERKKPCCP
eukprot:TRINITY_DN16539_c0_g3_i2.p1 TRINITY_DN16539_c0_g3~~TRINITY_DN16539_c0_g3_i2.p1  ORF type:complete len:184 (-),score=10.95 TRINITY_DN16539_c0_g3_i2:48-545(-)